MSGSDEDASVLERRDGADAWLDQARWLHQQEIARLDGTRTRATTMLGFAGAILAILARQPVPEHHTAASVIAAALAIAGTVLFATSAILLAIVLWNVLVTRPSHEALLAEWHDWRKHAALPQESPKRKVFLSRDFAGLLLHSESGDANSPVATASVVATSRASTLNIASGVFAVGLVLVAGSIVANLVGGLT
jgi:uncharacterized membrane protein YgdD (TMEM256/DUF423 family)